MIHNKKEIMATAENYHVYSKKLRRTNLYSGLLGVVGGIDTVLVEQKCKQVGHIVRITNEGPFLEGEEIVHDPQSTPEESTTMATSILRSVILAYGNGSIALFRPRTHVEDLGDWVIQHENRLA